VPVLWDIETGRVVSNESADIGTHPMLNPSRIVPERPDIDFSLPHGRA
jgi:glutathionyl-hydroquinone reductase